MAHWRMCIKKTVMSNRLGYPVFRWVYDPPFCRGGEVSTRISEGLLVVKKCGVSKGQPGKWGFSYVEGAMRKIDSFGWPQPPHLEDIFQTMNDLREKFPAKDMKSGMLTIRSTPEAKKILIELQETWQSIKERGETVWPVSDNLKLLGSRKFSKTSFRE